MGVHHKSHGLSVYHHLPVYNCQGNSCHHCSFSGPTDQHFDAKVENDDGHSDLETVVATLSWDHGIMGSWDHGPIVNGC